MGPAWWTRQAVRGLAALVVEALRELREEKDAEVEALRAEKDAQIASQREQISELSARLAAIERRLATLSESSKGGVQ